MNQVLILRPEAQARELQASVQAVAKELQLAVQTDVASMVKVQAYDDPNWRMADVLQQTWDGAMMVSVNAADFFAQQWREWAPDVKLKPTRWYAVGPTSARAIARVVQRPVVCAWREHNSEALLKLPELQQVEGQSWLVVRGRQGRDFFANTLRARGAQVTYLEVYERKPQAVEAQRIAHWRDNVRTIMVSSAEQLGYFLAAMPQDALSWLTTCDWIVASERLRDLLPVALQQRVAIAHSAASFAMVAAWRDLLTKGRHSE